MSSMQTTSTMSTSEKNLSALLALLSADILKEFIHRCIDEICGRKGPEEDRFCSLCSWTPSQFKEALSSCKTFLVDCIVNSHDKVKMNEVLVLSESHINAVANCLTVRGEELQRSLLNQCQNLCLESLTDFDWKVKWVMGSSSLCSLEETLLELDLLTTKSEHVPSTSSVNGRIRLELTRDNINSLINALEKGQESMKQHVVKNNF